MPFSNKNITESKQREPRQQKEFPAGESPLMIPGPAGSIELITTSPQRRM